MDIIFKCPNCEQELEVDSSAAGSTFDCPSCAKELTVPNGIEAAPATPPLVATPPPAPKKEEKHFVVPNRNTPAEALISKPNKPLEIAARESDKKVRIKTFKRTDCQEVGRDHFDEIVSRFLDTVGQKNIVSINPISYSTVDIGTHQVVTDYGVLIVFRG